jgi:hypothetical protein
MIIKVACPCGHAGIAYAHTLPRSLTCSACGMSRRVEPDGDARIVSTERRIENVNNMFKAAGSAA